MYLREFQKQLVETSSALKFQASGEQAAPQPIAMEMRKHAHKGVDARPQLHSIDIITSENDGIQN